MKRQLERRIEQAMQEAIARREWAGRPFTVGDICEDLRPLMESPEIRDAIALDRITEILEEERLKTGSCPTVQDGKRLLERELQRLKLSEADQRARLAELFIREVDEADIN